MHNQNILRALAVASVLIAGSCAAGSNDGNTLMADPAVNHPITVEPSYRALKVGFAGPLDGMNSADAARFDAFLSEYRAHGNGSISISVPSGPPSRVAIEYFAERAAASGIGRDKILVSTHDVVDGDFRVDVNYIAYTARVEGCEDKWSENLAYSADNITPKAFGCATRQNIAAMVADPRDLQGPRNTDVADVRRSDVVLGLYVDGKVTAAEKRKSDLGNEQSGSSSNIGK